MPAPTITPEEEMSAWPMLLGLGALMLFAAIVGTLFRKT
jgi:hypothetical protein